MPPLRVGVVADDLIWATWLGRAVREAGATVVDVRSPAALAPVIDALDAVVVDLTSRAASAVEAIDIATRAGRPALAIGPHDAPALRDRARAAGADRVLAYRAVHGTDGAAVSRWLADLAAGRPASRAPVGAAPAQ